MLKREKGGYTVSCDNQNCDNYHECCNDDPFESMGFREILEDMKDYDWTYWKDDFGEWKHFCPFCNFTKKLE